MDYIISEIFFTQRISQIRQIFFHQMCLCSEFAKVSHNQSFSPYGKYLKIEVKITSLALKLDSHWA